MTEIFQKKPRITILATIAFSFVILFVFAEAYLRVTIRYNPKYYTQLKGLTNSVVTYPYGTIPFNSLGFPDSEFSATKSLPRVAYVGDSVCYGVGAGYGYRISELLEHKFPGYEHMNISAGLGQGLSLRGLDHVVARVRSLHVDKVIYLMNLNDILPTHIAGSGDIDNVRFFSRIERPFRNLLRGKSYVYTQLRYTVKNIFERLGYQTGGFKSFEFYPDEYLHIFSQTVDRIAKFNEILKQDGVDLVVVILPYEMQISAEAEKAYESYGIMWDESFITFRAQEILEELFNKKEIPYVDALFAFLEVDDIQQSRHKNRLGQYYVYNLGDKLDWNHPNRKGNNRIAEHLGSELEGWFFMD